MADYGRIAGYSPESGNETCCLFSEHHRACENVIFTAGIKDVILQSSPNQQYGTLVFILSSLVEQPISSAQTVAYLGETERVCHWGMEE